jgi:hypothetical protein
MPLEYAAARPIPANDDDHHLPHCHKRLSAAQRRARHASSASASRPGQTPMQARGAVEAVFSALGETIPHDEFLDVTAELPYEYTSVGARVNDRLAPARLSPNQVPRTPYQQEDDDGHPDGTGRSPVAARPQPPLQ